MAHLTNSEVTFVGISVNASKIDVASTRKYLAQLEQRLSLPCCDSVRAGVAPIVDHMMRTYGIARERRKQ